MKLTPQEQRAIASDLRKQAETAEDDLAGDHWEVRQQTC